MAFKKFFRRRRHLPIRRSIRRVPVRRRRFKRFSRRRALARVQNNVRFTCKRYQTYGCQWPINDAESVPSNINTEKWTETLTPNLFFLDNYQFLRNLIDYQWVKFNYIAVKISELSYVGFQTPKSYGTSPAVIVPTGITSHQAQKYPMYFCWDLEEDMSFGDTSQTKLDARSLAQYQYTKRLTPVSRKPITFMHRFPMPWRQFYQCYRVRNTDYTKNWVDFMLAVSNIQDLRMPKYLLGTHPNWWGTGLPDDSHFANIATQFAITYYVGVTFRGRRIMGPQSAIVLPPIEPPIEEEIVDKEE